MSRWRIKHPKSTGLRGSGTFRMHSDDCACFFCGSIRQQQQLDQIHQELAEAEASGDETRYERTLRVRGAFLQL